VPADSEEGNSKLFISVITISVNIIEDIIFSLHIHLYFQISSHFKFFKRFSFDCLGFNENCRSNLSLIDILIHNCSRLGAKMSSWKLILTHPMLVCFGYFTKPLGYLFIICPSRRLQKVMCYRLSVRMEKLDSNCTNFHEISYYRRVIKSVHQIQVRLNKPKGTDTLHGDRCALIFISRHLRDS